MRSPAALLSLSNRLDVYVTASAGSVWRATSFDGGNTWAQPWTQVTGDGVQTGTLSSTFGPKAAGSGDGRVTYLVGRSSTVSDQGFWFSSSEDYHVHWGYGWTFGNRANCGLPYNAGCNTLSPTVGSGGWSKVADGTGVFTSGPAVATSGNGQTVYIVGMGTNSTMSWAKSTNAGTSWAVAWSQIPDGSGFHAGPAIAASGDGQIVYVVAQGGDNKMYYTKSINGGSTWSASWSVIGSGTFPAGTVPAIATSADGNTVYVVAQGLNPYMMYYAQSITAGGTWSVAWAAIGSGTFPLGCGPSVATSWDASTLHVFAQGDDGNIWRATGSKAGGGVTWTFAWGIAGGPAPA
jgi:hypothetical protein